MASQRKVAHVPSEVSRRQVRAMAAYGTIPECIAVVVGCSVEELRRGYEEELETAEIEAVTKVAESLYKRALAGDNQAAIFILKSRAGWKDK